MAEITKLKELSPSETSSASSIYPEEVIEILASVLEKIDQSTASVVVTRPNCFPADLFSEEIYFVRLEVSIIAMMLSI